MKIKYIIFFILIQTLFANAQSLVVIYDYNKAIQEAQKKGKQLMIFSYGNSCPYCRNMEGNTLDNDKIIEFINKNFIFLKAETSSSNSGSFFFIDQNIPKYLNPQYIPTTYIIDPKTQAEIRTLIGYKSPKQFIRELFD
jgi:thioredoxin-related protein